MDPIVKTKWLEALRSGEYRQSKGYLYRPSEDGYCCLGVLCELAVKNGVIAPMNIDGGDAFYDGAYTSPSQKVLNWAGMSDAFSAYAGAGYGNKLIEMNDDDSEPFTVIADWIEENL